MQWADDPAPGTNLPTYSVSEVSGRVRQTLETAFSRIQVRGEISRPKYHSSGHLYLTLKDDKSVLDGVCWRGRASKLPFRAEEGLEVVATGRISSYAGGGGSRYQLVIEDLQLAGEGAILKLLEQRKRQLAEEGLFDEERKQPLPFLPQVIGVVTSPTGAVIQDILHRLEERFPRRVLLWPVKVQGDGAAEQVAAAIQGFNALGDASTLPRPDLLIVARGGGSLEDLWAFNEEIVVRAAAASAIPLIAAIGHESDTTLIDLAADRRAPTPTAAAEMAVPVRSELDQLLQTLEQRLAAGLRRDLREKQARIEGLARGLPEPRRLLETAIQQLDERSERLERAIQGLLERRQTQVEQAAAGIPHPRQQVALAAERLEVAAKALASQTRRRLERAEEALTRSDAERRLPLALKRSLAAKQEALTGLARVLEGLSHRRVQERGYALVTADGKLVTRAAAVAPGADLSLSFADGEVAARALGEAPPPKPKPKPRKSDQRQGKLL
ncbi:MAG: exodeoxyribonuclease VII large subunit [Pseudomonadota bacterium]